MRYALRSTMYIVGRCLVLFLSVKLPLERYKICMLVSGSKLVRNRQMEFMNCFSRVHIVVNMPPSFFRQVFLSGSLVHTDDLTHAGFHHITFHLLPTDDHGMLMVEVQSQLCGTVARDTLWLQRATFFDRQAFTLKILFFLTCFLFVTAVCYRKRSALAAVCSELRIHLSHLSLRWRRRLSRLEDPVLPLHQPLPTSSSWSLLRPLCFLRALIVKAVRSVSVRFRREQQHRLYWSGLRMRMGPEFLVKKSIFLLSGVDNPYPRRVTDYGWEHLSLSVACNDVTS